MPPAVNHLYRGAVTVHRHLNGQSSLLASAPSAPLQVESTSQKESNDAKNKSTEKSKTDNTAKTGEGWDAYQKSNQEKIKALPEK